MTSLNTCLRSKSYLQAGGANGAVTILATFAEFESDLMRMRTKEGMAIARVKGKLKGKKPKLSVRRQTELRRM